MVCATNSIIMTHSDIENQVCAKFNTAQEESDLDMILDDDDDSDEEDLSSQDENITTNSSPSASSCSTSTSTNKRISTQPLFLNFTSDLSPQKMSKKKPKPKKQTAYRVNGVNILNRNNLDSKTAIERIQRRRENHNHVERRRRDNINNIIFELSSVVPNATQPGQKPNKGNILKLTLDYIKDLQAENQLLKDRLNPSSTSVDENILLKSVTNFSQSPSAPNSPTRFVRNALSVQSVSVPSSPRNHHHHEDTVINLTTAPPLTLPPQQQHHHHHHPPTFTSSTPPPSSIISAHSNTSSPVPASTESCTSSPSISNVLIPTVTSGYHNYHGYHYNSPPVAALSVSIPQPPQLYNYKQQQQQQQQQQQHPEAVQFKQTNNKPGTPPGLRPLLPATNKYPQQQQHPPSVRMSGYEKIYGNVCRY